MEAQRCDFSLKRDRRAVREDTRQLLSYRSTINPLCHTPSTGHGALPIGLHIVYSLEYTYKYVNRQENASCPGLCPLLRPVKNSPASLKCSRRSRSWGP